MNSLFHETNRRVHEAFCCGASLGLLPQAYLNFEKVPLGVALPILTGAILGGAYVTDAQKPLRWKSEKYFVVAFDSLCLAGVVTTGLLVAAVSQEIL